MSQTHRCPDCRTLITYTPDRAGELAACPGCQEMVMLPGSPATPPIPRTGPVPMPKTGAKAPPPVPKTTASNLPPVPKTTVSDAPPLPPRPSKASAPPPIQKTAAMPAPAEEDRPAKPRRPQEPEPKSNVGLIVAIAVGGMLLVGGGAVAVVLMLVNAEAKKDPEKEPVAKSGDKDGEKKAVAASKDKEKAAPVKPAAPSVTPEQVYRRVLRSTAWVVTGGGTASGVLIDGKEKLVLTSYHVVAGFPSVRVHFPDFDGDAPVTSPKAYMDRAGTPARLVARRPGADLALLQLQEPHLGVLPLAMDTLTPKEGDALLAVGAVGLGPDGAGKLWQRADAKVGRTDTRRLRLQRDQMYSAATVEAMTEPARDGSDDSGGPVVNAHGRLVAVVSAVRPLFPGGATYTDLSEIRELLKEKPLSDDAAPDAVPKSELPRLMVALRGNDAKAKQDAIKAIGSMGPDGQEAVPVLLDQWGKADPKTAADITTALERIGPPSAADIDVLREALKSDRREAKVYALGALERMGRKGDRALPELMAATGDKDSEIRAAALKTLPSVGNPEKAGVVRTLVDGLKDERQIVKLAALSGLNKVGKDVRREVYEPLLSVLADPDTKVMETAQAVIASLGKVTEDDLDILRRALGHAGARVRVYAAVCLSDIGKKSLPALAELSKAIADADADVRKASINAVSQLGKEAAPAVKTLIAALGDAETQVRAAAAATLGAIGREPGVYPALLRALKDKNGAVKAAAAGAFKDLGKPLEQDVADVVKCLSDDNPYVRTFAAEGLGKLEKEAKAAWPELARLATKDKSVRVRLAAVEALGEGGADARDHAAALAASLNDKVVLGADDKLPVDAPEPGEAPTGGGTEEEKVYRKLLLSAVWVVAERRFTGRAAASGFVVDSRNRLVVTSARVAAARGQQVAVFPPRGLKKTLITDPNDYLVQASRVGLVGQVVDVDPVRDIALIRLPVMWASLRALPFAGKSSKPGDPVHAVGTDGDAAPSGGGTLFQHKTDKVEVVADRKDAIGFRRVSGLMVETVGPLHSNDAGGPVVNPRLELVGMRIAYNRGGSAMCLEGTQVLSYVQAVSARTLVPFRQATAEAEEVAANPLTRSTEGLTQAAYRTALLKALNKIGLGDAPAAVEAVTRALTDADLKVRAQALTLLAPLGDKLQPHWRNILPLCAVEETRKTGEELLAKMGEKLLPDLYAHVRSSLKTPEMLAGVRVMHGMGLKSGAKTYLNRIAENAERKYPDDVRKAAREAMRTLAD